MLSRWLISAGLTLNLTVAANHVCAQVPPPGTQPGQIQRQFERPPEPSAKPGAITIPEASLKAPQNAASVKLLLKRLTIDGVTVYRPETLGPLYASLLDKEVTLADIYDAVARLTARYRNDGYILSQVFVPAQTVEDGAVRLQAVEGYVAHVRVEGGSAALKRRAARYGEKIRASRPLRMAALERYVLLLNDLAGITAHVVLSPSALPGASDLTVQVSARRALASLASDNRGGRAQGPGRALADVDLHSLTGVGSRTELRGVTTFNPELAYVEAAHDQFVGAEGGKFEVAASYAHSTPKELSIVPLNLKTSSGAARASYTHPAIRSRSHNLYVRGVLSAFDGTTTVFGVKDTIDRVRSAALGVTYDSADRFGGVSVIDAAFTQGLKGLGASRGGDQLLSRATGRADFRKATLYAQRAQSLSGGLLLLLGVEAQYAFTDLLASEMFSVGGELFGRGYDPSAMLNDHGAAVKADLRYNRTWGSRTPVTVVPYVFGDLGKVWQRTPVPGIRSWESAASAGGGVRVDLGSRVSGYVEIARPFNRIVGQESSRDPRLYAGLTVR
jgi:hemolysin activation/secretion protein